MHLKIFENKKMNRIVPIDQLKAAEAIDEIADALEENKEKSCRKVYIVKILEEF